MQSLEAVTVGLQGLGPLNWVAKKVILGVVQQNIHNILLFNGREIIRHLSDILRVRLKGRRVKFGNLDSFITKISELNLRNELKKVSIVDQMFVNILQQKLI